MNRNPITAVVLTLNEERFLGDCLASIKPLTDQIIVVDSGSTDATIEIARQSGYRLEHRSFHGYASQRNFAMKLVRSPWVLFLDADERLRNPLVDEIRSSIDTAPAEVAGFWIPRRNLFFNKWLQGGGWWPDYQARLLRVDRASYGARREVHELVVFHGATRKLSQAMIHINYESRSEFIGKQLRYARLKAEHSTETPSRKAYVSMPVREFWRRLVSLKGYRDGLTGLFLSTVMSYQEIAFVYLQRRQNTSTEAS